MLCDGGPYRHNRDIVVLLHVAHMLLDAFQHQLDQPAHVAGTSLVDRRLQALEPEQLIALRPRRR
jgi:hypothetical protein